MNLLLRGAACASLLALVAGCCANNTCNCDDLYADSLYLSFAIHTNNSNINADTANTSFTRSELDTVYLQRYTPAKAAVPANGAIPAVPAKAAAYSDPQAIVLAQQTTINSRLKARLDAAQLLAKYTLVISNSTPFQPSVSGGKLNAYGYILTIHDRAVKNAGTYVDTLKQIQLQGRYNADGCCTCYENTQKTLVLQGKQLTSLDVTEKTTQQDPTTKQVINVPVPIPITKLD